MLTAASGPLASQLRYHDFRPGTNRHNHKAFSEALLMFLPFSSPPMTRGCWNQIPACLLSSQLLCAVPGRSLVSRSMLSPPSLMPAWCTAARSLWQRASGTRQTSWVWWLWTRISLMLGWNYCPLRTKQKVFVCSQTRAWTSPALELVRCNLYSNFDSYCPWEKPLGAGGETHFCTFSCWRDFTMSLPVASTISAESTFIDLSKVFITWGSWDKFSKPNIHTKEDC